METTENIRKGRAVGGFIGILAAAVPAAMTYGNFALTGFASLGTSASVTLLPFLPAMAPAVAGALAAAAVVGAGLFIGRLIGSILGAAKDQKEFEVRDAIQAPSQDRAPGLEPELVQGKGKDAPSQDLPSMDLPQGKEASAPATKAPEIDNGINYRNDFAKNEEQRRAARNSPNSAMNFETSMMR